jgi:hypothetical protein
VGGSSAALPGRSASLSRPTAAAPPLPSRLTPPPLSPLPPLPPLPPPTETEPAATYQVRLASRDLCSSMYAPMYVPYVCLSGCLDCRSQARSASELRSQQPAIAPPAVPSPSDEETALPEGEGLLDDSLGGGAGAAVTSARRGGGEALAAGGAGEGDARAGPSGAGGARGGGGGGGGGGRAAAAGGGGAWVGGSQGLTRRGRGAARPPVKKCRI